MHMDSKQTIRTGRDLCEIFQEKRVEEGVEKCEKKYPCACSILKTKKPIYQMPYRYNYILILSKAVTIKLIKLLEY